jgi:hypothetical protein
MSEPCYGLVDAELVCDEVIHEYKFRKCASGKVVHYMEFKMEMYTTGCTDEKEKQGTG